MLQGGYLAHWQRAALTHRGDPDFRLAQRIIDAEKVVISKRIAKTSWERTRPLGGPLADAVNSLKARVETRSSASAEPASPQPSRRRPSRRVAVLLADWPRS